MKIGRERIQQQIDTLRRATNERASLSGWTVESKFDDTYLQLLDTLLNNTLENKPLKRHSDNRFANRCMAVSIRFWALESGNGQFVRYARNLADIAADIRDIISGKASPESFEIRIR